MSDPKYSVTGLFQIYPHRTGHRHYGGGKVGAMRERKIECPVCSERLAGIIYHQGAQLNIRTQAG